MRRRIEEGPWDDEEPDDDEDTIPCPYCGHPIFDDTPRCPHCENYLSDRGGGALAQTVVDRAGCRRVPVSRVPLDHLAIG